MKTITILPAAMLAITCATPAFAEAGAASSTRSQSNTQVQTDAGGNNQNKPSVKGVEKGAGADADADADANASSGRNQTEDTTTDNNTDTQELMDNVNTKGLINNRAASENSGMDNSLTRPSFKREAVDGKADDE